MALHARNLQDNLPFAKTVKKSIKQMDNQLHGQISNHKHHGNYFTTTTSTFQWSLLYLRWNSLLHRNCTKRWMLIHTRSGKDHILKENLYSIPLWMQVDLKNWSHGFLGSKIVIQVFGKIGNPHVHSRNIVACVFDVLDINVKRWQYWDPHSLGYSTQLVTYSNR